MTPIKDIIIATALSGVIIFILRAIPFLIFLNRPAPKYLSFFEKYLPPVAIFCLLIYCLRDTDFSTFHGWIPQLCALAFTVGTFLWKRNSILSIFGGTILFMILGKFI